MFYFLTNTTVSLDRALLSSSIGCLSAICFLLLLLFAFCQTFQKNVCMNVCMYVSVTVWQQRAMQILTGSSDPPNLPFPCGPRPLSITVLHGTTLVSLPNGISFSPTALTGCMSVTDIQTGEPQSGNICHNRQNLSIYPSIHLFIHLCTYLLTSLLLISWFISLFIPFFF